MAGIPTCTTRTPWPNFRIQKDTKKSTSPTDIGFSTKKFSGIVGLEKRGFGKGYFLGIGGKVENEESIEDGAKRELAEEINIIPLELQKVAILGFYFPHIIDESWNQQVYVFTSSLWQGKPKETEEIKPLWLIKKRIPYEKMWDDAHYWLPNVLQGQELEGEFLFDKNLKVIDYSIKSLR